jgi:hypothetical protein
MPDMNAFSGDSTRHTPVSLKKQKVPGVLKRRQSWYIRKFTEPKIARGIFH